MSLGPVTLLLSLPNGGALYQDMLRERRMKMAGATPLNRGAAIIRPYLAAANAEIAALGGALDENGRSIRGTIRRNFNAKVFRYARKHGIPIPDGALFTLGMAGATAREQVLMELAEIRRI